MADFAVLGIGIDPKAAESGGKRVENQLNTIIKKQRDIGSQSKTSFAAMGAGLATANLALQAFNQVLGASVQGIKDVIQTGRDFESTMSRVRAVSQANVSDFQKLTNAAREMGATTKFSATQAAEGLEFLSMAGFTASQSTQALPGVLQLAAASGVELGRAADIASNALTAMGLKISELGRVNDVLLSTTTGANVNINQMAESLKYAAPLAATTGTSIEQLSALIGALGNAGIQGSQAGTSLAGAMSRLLNPTTEVSKVLAELNVTTGKGLIDTLRQLEKAGATSAQIMKIFGEEAGRSILAIQTSGGIGAVDKLIDRLNQASGMAERTAKMMSENLDGAIKNLSSSLESVRIDIFNESSDEMRQIVDMVTQSIRNNEAGFIAIGTAIENGAKAVLTMTKNSDALTVVLRGVEAGADAVTIVITTLGTMANSVALRFEYLASAGTAMALALTGDIDKLSFALEDLDRISQKSTDNLTDGLSHVIDAFDGLIGRRQEVLRLGEGQEQTNKKEASSLGDIATKSAQAQTEIKKANDEIVKKSEVTDIATQAIQSMTTAQIEQVDTSYAVVDQTQREIQALDQLAGKYNVVADTASRAAQRSKDLANSGLSGPGGLIPGLSGTSFTAYVPNSVASQWFGSGAIGQSTGSMQSPTGGFSQPSFSSQPTTQTGLANAANRQIQTLYKGFLGLGSQIEDYLLSQESVNSQLEAYQDRLIEKTREFADLADDDLDGRLEKSQDIFAIQKQIDSLTEQNRQKEAQAARSVESILSGTLDFYEEIRLADIGGLLPIEQFGLIEQKFVAVSNALAGIDWTELTEADQMIISQFQSTAEQYLKSAQDVYKSGDPYQVVKDTVLLQTEDLATKLVGKFGAIDTSEIDQKTGLLKTSLLALSPALSGASGSVSDLSWVIGPTDYAGLRSNLSYAGTRVNSLSTNLAGSAGLGASATVANTGVSGLRSGLSGPGGLGTSAIDTTNQMMTLRSGLTGSGGFSEALNLVSQQSEDAAGSVNSSAGQMQNVASASNNASSNASGLTASLSERAGFQNFSNSLFNLKENLQNTANYIETRSVQMAQNVGSGGSGSSTPIQNIAAPAPVAPTTKSFTGFNVSGNMVFAVYSDGTQRYIDIGQPSNPTYTRSISGYSYSGNNIDIMVADKFMNSVINSTVKRTAAPVLPLASGKWNINSATQPALLHQGEMVIRQDDAPAVRSMMRSSGMSEKYGVSSTGSSAAGSRLEAVLDAILMALENPVSPTITINAQRLNQELDRQRRLQS